MEDKKIIDYARSSSNSVITELRSSKTGLLSKEAHRRLYEHGKNVISEEHKFNLLTEFLANFKNPFVVILVFAALVSFGLGQNADAIIVMIIVLVSVILNFFQEYSASRAAEKLKEQLIATSTLLRNGVTEEVAVANVCVGDVVVLSAGDLVPADARIIEADDFFVNQSSLTGESFPVEKVDQEFKGEHASLSDLSNMVLMGTNVETGTARAIVVMTGKDTEFGKVAKELNAKDDESGYNKGLASFSYIILKVTIFVVLTVFFINVVLKHDILQAFLFAVAVAVGLTPELLPMIMSISMGRGSLAMAKKGVIVKKLSAIPNLGSMDVLCTDKTGTLTKDKIELVKYTDCYGKASNKVFLNAYLNSFYQTGIKNPMDQAVINFESLKIDGYKKISEIPFDFVRKKMSVVVEKAGERILITKGAPEEILKSTIKIDVDNSLTELDNSIKDKIMEQYNLFSNDGYRVLAVAIKKIDLHEEKYTKDEESGLILLGFIAFLDPAKKDVKKSLVELEKMGIEVKVITGDNELVTKKICNEVGLEIKGILRGYELESMTDDALRIVVEKTTVFARFSPNEKNRVINALKQNGHVVGYMGDGINDSPSLKNADVGISVSNAVDVAKESAKIILTRKSLRVLKDGVLEGRKTFGNTMKYIMMGVSSNFGNMFSIIGAVLFLPYLPMLPVQILLNNLLYDFSQITIPSDKVDEEYISKPKHWNLKFLKRFMFIFGPVSSIFDFVTFFIMYSLFHASAGVFQTGWFLQSLATQTLVIHVIRTRKLAFIQSSASRYLFISTFLCVGIGWLLPYTSVGRFFGFVELPKELLFTLVIIVVVYLLVIELVKKWFYKRYSY